MSSLVRTPFKSFTYKLKMTEKQERRLYIENIIKCKKNCRLLTLALFILGPSGKENKTAKQVFKVDSFSCSTPRWVYQLSQIVGYSLPQNIRWEHCLLQLASGCWMLAKGIFQSLQLNSIDCTQKKVYTYGTQWYQIRLFIYLALQLLHIRELAVLSPFLPSWKMGRFFLEKCDQKGFCPNCMGLNIRSRSWIKRDFATLINCYHLHQSYLVAGAFFTGTNRWYFWQVALFIREENIEETWEVITEASSH